MENKGLIAYLLQCPEERLESVLKEMVKFIKKQKVRKDDENGKN